ncbi:MAG: hypothetical protein JSS68_09735 [Actinobacteria bacterium]|nr:hypothetical protein [Actinomycetota bacterium]
MTRDDFEIVTKPANGTGPEDWTVRAIWHGARRIVFTGSVYACCHWVREQLAAAA